MRTSLFLLASLSILISCVNPSEKRNEAYKLMKAGEFDKALIAINKAIKIEPQNIANYGARIFIYDATGKFKEEIEDLTKIIELNKNSKSINAHYQRAIVRTQLGHYEKALSDINYFIANYTPDTITGLADAYLNKASIHYQLNDFQKAREYYEKAIKENSGKNNSIESEALVGLANLTSVPQNALRILNKAIEIDNKNALAYGARGFLLMNSLANTNGAYKDFRRAISLDNHDANLYSHMGQLFLFNLNLVDSAEMCFRRAIELSPQSPKNSLIYTNLGIMSYHAGNMNQAIIEFEKAEKLNSEDELLLYNYAMALSDFGNEKEALTKISRAIHINPHKAEYFNLKGSILMGLSSFMEAESALKAAIRINNQFGGAYYNLGYLYGEQNAHKESIHYYDKAVSLNFNLKATLVNRALQKFKLNKTSDGCFDLNRAYKLGREDVKPYIDTYCN